jgi:hypothetical protein
MQIQASVHEVCSAAKQVSSFFEKKEPKKLLLLGARGRGSPLIGTPYAD